MTKHDARSVEQMHFDAFKINGVLGSIDVDQFEWMNCPNSLRGQYAGRSKKPTIALEAGIDHNLWIWHWNFGEPGSCNDINTWERSNMFQDMIHGKMHDIDFDFTINA